MLTLLLTKQENRVRFGPVGAGSNRDLLHTQKIINKKAAFLRGMKIEQRYQNIAWDRPCCIFFCGGAGHGCTDKIKQVLSPAHLFLLLKFAHYLERRVTY
jgi:hypothetical protein